MNVDSKKIKLFSTIGQRATVGMCCLEIVKKYPELMVLTADVSTSAGLDRFRKTYKDNYLDVGIAEQNLISVAAGIASEGYKVITTTFSPFQTLRCCEQIKVNLGYSKEKISMIGLASGLALGHLGFTHCSIEDIGVLRSIPNLSIVSPADSLEVVKSIEASLEYPNSVYIRLTGTSNIPIIYKEDYNFEIGKGVVLRAGKDITIFSNGVICNLALEIAEELQSNNISVEVINLHTVKPLDKELIENCCQNKKLMVSLEEHNIIGGLGSSIAEFKSTISKSPKQLFFGINDYYAKGGEYNFLKKEYKLSKENISKSIIDEFRKI